MEASDARADCLVRRIKEGDLDAFEDLYRLYLAPLYGYMAVALENHHEAEDAAHEVFVKVLRALPSYEARGIPFRIWLFRIARNHVLDERQRLGRSRPEEPEFLQIRRELEGWDVEPPDEDPGNEEFYRLIQRLPVGQRQVLVLRHVFDMSFREIASVLGTTEQAARNQQRRAFDSLRPRLMPRRETEVRAVYRVPMSRLMRPQRVAHGRREALRHPVRFGLRVG